MVSACMVVDYYYISIYISIFYHSLHCFPLLVILFFLYFYLSWLGLPSVLYSRPLSLAFVLVCLLLLFLSYLLILSFFYFHFLALAYMSYPANLFASHFLLAFFSSFFLDPFPTPLNSFLSLLTFFPYLPLVIYREEVALVLFWLWCGGVYWVRWMQYMPLSRCDLSLEFPPPVFPPLQSSPAHILLAIPNTYISPTMYCIYR